MSAKIIPFPLAYYTQPKTLVQTNGGVKVYDLTLEDSIEECLFDFAEQIQKATFTDGTWSDILIQDFALRIKDIAEKYHGGFDESA